MDVKTWLGENNKIGIDIWEKKYRYNNETFDEWLDRVSGGNPALRRIIEQRKFLFGGRTLSNRGTGKSGSFSNCYSKGFVEDSLEDIMQTNTDIAKTFKSQGGQGISLSKLRPRGCGINHGQFQSDGIVPFMEIFNKTTESISQGGCIAEDELVLTDSGYKPIKDIEVGDMVHTKKGFQGVLTKWDKGIRPVYKVTTNKGYTIKTTIDHKFCVNGYSGVVPLKELKPGDNVNLISRVIEKNPGYDAQAYFLANFYANGYVHSNGTGSITLHKDYKEVGDRLIAFINSLGFNGYYRNNEKENALRVVLNTEMCNWIKDNGFSKGKCYDIHIPEYIMKGNSSVVLSYLAGLLDSDGCYKDGNVFSYTTVCEDYARQVSQLMKQVGFFPTINKQDRSNQKNKVPLYEVRSAFYINIPMDSIKIRLKGAGVVKNSRYVTPYTMKNTGISPSDAKHLQKIGKNDNIGLYTYCQIKNAPYDPIIYDQISSIEPVGECQVYDIEVEDEHKFDCNGFYVSNSRKGALLLSLDAWHKEAEQFITIKSQTGEIQKANLSLEIDDEFMECIKKYYETGEVVTKHIKKCYGSDNWVEYDVKPIELYKTMMESAHMYAEPGCIFTERFRNYNMMQCCDDYQVETANPCGKVFASR